ncbi:MAG: 3-hydroxyacyl-ACP dehydratase FabZ [Simkaniaceae bacterium]|nr:3-hydroxyacyl-ACP dehydratase FabZ [Simkaniaceae bacterium]
MTILNTKEILKILPHRYPFLLVDRIIEIDLEAGTIVGQKNVTMNEHFFQGHFPVAPIMPGVLILEALAQAGGILIHQKGYDKKIALLLSVTDAKFRRPVTPGDVLHLHAELIHIGSKGGKVNAVAKVDGKPVAQATIGFALIDAEQV